MCLAVLPSLLLLLLCRELLFLPKSFNDFLFVLLHTNRYPSALELNRFYAFSDFKIGKQVAFKNPETNKLSATDAPFIYYTRCSVIPVTVEMLADKRISE